MRPYQAPLKDMQFVLNDVLKIEQLYQDLPQYQDKVSQDLFAQYLQVAADFCQNELYLL